MSLVKNGMGKGREQREDCKRNKEYLWTWKNKAMQQQRG